MNHEKWSCIKGTVIGDSHTRKGMRNQDAISYFIHRSRNSHILAVADGHGSDSCKRSHTGSQIATIVAKDVLAEFHRSIDKFCRSLEKRPIDFQSKGKSSFRVNSIRSTLRKDLPKDLVRLWGKRVAEDLLRNPVPADSIITNPNLLYGTTLIVVMVSDGFGIFVQLGDGDILLVNDDQSVTPLFSEGTAKIGDDTYSLCLPDSHKQFKVDFQLFESAETRPRAILVCTDGFSNAFKNTESFHQAAIDFSNLLSTSNGQDSVRNSLHSWLQEYSTYSGDDVSLGLLFRTNTVTNASPDSGDALPQEHLKS